MVSECEYDHSRKAHRYGTSNNVSKRNNPDSQTVQCRGCGGKVPAVDGPTHPYMAASPGCWEIYGRVLARPMTATPTVWHWHHVDCYAVQHPGGAKYDHRQRSSVAVHLISLCLLHEFGRSSVQAAARRGRISATVLPRLGRSDWPYLPPPHSLGSITVVDVAAATEYDQALREWTEQAWDARKEHHEIIRSWARIAVGRTS